MRQPAARQWSLLASSPSFTSWLRVRSPFPWPRTDERRPVGGLVRKRTIVMVPRRVRASRTEPRCLAAPGPGCRDPWQRGRGAIVSVPGDLDPPSAQQPQDDTAFPPHLALPARPRSIPGRAPTGRLAASANHPPEGTGVAGPWASLRLVALTNRAWRTRLGWRAGSVTGEHGYCPEAPPEAREGCQSPLRGKVRRHLGHDNFSTRAGLELSSWSGLHSPKRPCQSRSNPGAPHPGTRPAAANHRVPRGGKARGLGQP